MPRSIKKGPFIDHHLLKKVEDAVNTNNRKPNFWAQKGDGKPCPAGSSF